MPPADSPGLRGRSSLANVSVFIGTARLEVEYVGPQEDVAGLDQINVRLPKSLQISPAPGSPWSSLTVDGKGSNQELAIHINY